MAEVTGYALLAEAFAGEVAARLPALQAAVARLPDGAAEVVAHAHTLGSSAAVLGETLVAKAARACETLLLPYAGAGPVAGTGVPPGVAAAAAAEAEVVALLLAPWLLRGAA